MDHWETSKVTFLELKTWVEICTICDFWLRNEVRHASNDSYLSSNVRWLTHSNALAQSRNILTIPSVVDLRFLYPNRLLESWLCLCSILVNKKLFRKFVSDSALYNKVVISFLKIEVTFEIFMSEGETPVRNDKCTNCLEHFLMTLNGEGSIFRLEVAQSLTSSFSKTGPGTTEPAGFCFYGVFTWVTDWREPCLQVLWLYL